MRNVIAVLREIAWKCAGPTQWAVNLGWAHGVIETPWSRSSALASKATGFPSKIAAKLAWGIRWMNWTMTSMADARVLEPSIDYVVTKIPKFAFEKFRGPAVGHRDEIMGEAMSIRRSSMIRAKGATSVESGRPRL